MCFGYRKYKLFCKIPISPNIFLLTHIFSFIFFPWIKPPVYNLLTQLQYTSFLKTQIKFPKMELCMVLGLDPNKDTVLVTLYE